MSDKSKKQAKHKKHTIEKKHHGHEEISKKDLNKVHGGHQDQRDQIHGIGAADIS
jgi:hypothetical protein